MSHSCNISTREPAFSAHSANSLGALRLKGFDRREENSQRTTRFHRHSLFATITAVTMSVTSLAFPVWAEAGASSLPIQYTLTLTDPAAHKLHIMFNLPPGASERELQLPVWNALYQVRDFSQYVTWLKATDSQHRPITSEVLDKSRWRVSSTENGAELEYEMIADLPGPYGAQLNTQHAFFNLAETLMYPVDLRSAPIRLEFTDLPDG